MRIWGWFKDHQTQAAVGLVVAIAALLIAGLALARDYYGLEAAKPSSAPESPTPVETPGSSQPVLSPSPAETSRLAARTDPPPPGRLTDPPDRLAAPAVAGDREGTPPPRKATEPRSPEVVEDLSFKLSAVRTTANTVRVVPVATGRAETGRTYWFMIEADWGNGNTDYFPRRQVSASTPAFEVSIPPEADLKFARHGRIYALTSAESTAAESMRQRQQEQAGGTARDDTFFTNPPSQNASNAVRLPF